MPKKKVVIPELSEVANEVGNFIQYWGFKRIHGRIWAHLFLSLEPLDAGELIDRLAVSKALVSMSLSELMKYHVVLELGKSDRGTQLYQANPDLTQVIVGVLREREKKMLGKILKASQALQKISLQDLSGNKIDAKRIKILEKLVHGTSKALDMFMLKLNFDLSLLKKLKLIGRA